MIFLSFLDDGLDLLKTQAHLYTIASVAVFSWLDDPSIVLLGSFLFFVFVNLLGSFVVVLEELKIFGILYAFLDVECQWKIRKDVLLNIVVVVGHGVEKSFFVA